MDHPAPDPIALLALADPKLSGSLSAGLEKRSHPLPPEVLSGLVDFILKSISQEISLGETVAQSLAQLVESGDPEFLERFCRMTDEAAGIGPTFGRLMASHLGPVLRTVRPGLLRKFESAVRVMHAKGIHTLYEPLACLSDLIAAGDLAGAEAFLELMEETFAADLSYGQTRHFAHVLPQAAASFRRDRRATQLQQIRRVMATDTALVDALLEGLSLGLTFLSPDALDTFVTRGFEKVGGNPTAGRNFLSLSSGIARIVLEKLQTAVPLDEAKPGIERYLQARTGIRISVKSLSDLPASSWASGDAPPLVCTDGRHLYLVDVLDRYETRAENMALYRTLSRLESACIEFGTFDFELERLREACPELPHGGSATETGESDLVQFFALFPNPELAGNLFTIFEHGRLLRFAAARYPGLVRRLMPVLEKEICTCCQSASKDPGKLLYAGVTLGLGNAARLLEVPEISESVQTLCRRFENSAARLPAVESSALLAFEAYPVLASRDFQEGSRPFRFPFGMKIRPDLFRDACRHLTPLIDRIQAELEKQGQKAFRADIRKQLIETGGRLSPESFSVILASSRSRRDSTPPDGLPVDLYSRLSESLPDLFEPAGGVPDHPVDASQVFWYREWSAQIGDFLDRHVRVVEYLPPGDAEDMFEGVLKDYRGVVLTIRRAFELLKPQGLTFLRHWPDGEDIDLPALMAAVADRKSGHTPSDRIYSKRFKETRDVSVLLLVDLSGSTKNLVPGTRKSVLSVEKEAIVLFCEALQVVGDDFAVAGFSGRGRLQVDYYRYKEFEETVTRKVRRRISGMTPQRSTRTGAALRHATRVLSRRPSRVRLLILLSDGFPNDTGYKRDYAVADVRKAVAEAASKGVHVRPITINLWAEGNFDSLYGSLHHNVISDVRELPDTLWRIYCALTK